MGEASLESPSSDVYVCVCVCVEGEYDREARRQAKQQRCKRRVMTDDAKTAGRDGGS
jgi:hypothetical protein